MNNDAEQLVRRCESCQKFSPQIHQHPELHSLAPVWPFKRWGMDIVGKLPTAPGKLSYLLMATDYFTKWIEAGAYATIQETKVIDFVWKNIICRFGLHKRSFVIMTHSS